jgi:uncharacterized protein (DUF2267 family)
VEQPVKIILLRGRDKNFVFRHASSLFYMHIPVHMMYLMHAVVKALRRSIYKQQLTRCKSL